MRDSKDQIFPFMDHAFGIQRKNSFPNPVDSKDFLIRSLLNVFDFIFMPTESTFT